MRRFIKRLGLFLRGRRECPACSGVGSRYNSYDVGVCPECCGSGWWYIAWGWQLRRHCRELLAMVVFLVANVLAWVVIKVRGGRH